MAAATRAAFFDNTAGRATLARSLHRRCRARINRVRKTVGYDSLPAEDVTTSLETAISLGYFRANINRFSTDQGLDADWWREQRRIHAKTGKDRRQDFTIIAVNYPEFEEFEPSEPVTAREILDNAETELFDLLASSGTDYHRAHMEFYKVARFDGDTRNKLPELSMEGGVIVTHDEDTGEQQHVEVIDPSAQDRVENSFVYNMLDDDRNIFGPGLSRVVALAVSLYGRGGLFWVAEWLFFPGKYTELMRVVGLDEATLGQTKFEAVKRDMVRKIPQVHEDMLHRLKSDPVMLRLRDLLYGDEFFATLPMTREVLDENPHVQLAREEFKSYLTRWRAKMAEFCRTDLSLRTAVDVLEDDDGDLLRLFIMAQDRPDRMDLFRREVSKYTRGSTATQKAA